MFILWGIHKKIRTTAFFADEPELRIIAQIKDIWRFIKNHELNKPKKIAFVTYSGTNNDLVDHYNCIRTKINNSERDNNVNRFVNNNIGDIRKSGK